MPIITINDKEYNIPSGITIIKACELANIDIPRFCYHERLEIAGNCRMCLVEVIGGAPKPVASCATIANDGMKIFTNSEMVKKARAGTMEFLLANHPLDCPICDQGGECDLQDQAYQYGGAKGRFCENKRAVLPKDIGEFIKTEMTRCIHCTRCVRFITDIAGVPELGAVGRGEDMQITTYLEKAMTSELSGNTIDLCPVGALTSKPYSFKARAWELKKTYSIDIMDAMGSHIRIDSRGGEVMRILPQINEEINEEWISDKARFCYDGLRYQRLEKPYVKIAGRLESISFELAYKTIAEKISSMKPSEIAALSGKLSDCEEIFIIKSLLDALGCKNYECRLEGEKFDAKDKSSYLFNTTIAKIEESDVCLLIGINPRKTAPVLNTRIRKAFLNSQNKIAGVGIDENLSYKYKFLGNDAATLNDLLNGTSDFSETLLSAKKPMLIFGSDVISGDDGALILELLKQIAEKYKMVRNDWNGFNFLAKSSGLINGLVLDFTSENGVEEILKKAEKNEIKLMFLLNVDDDIDFSRLKNTFVIYIGSNADAGANIADLILPSKSFSEKNATFINCEGRVQSTSKAVFPSFATEETSKMICEIAKKLEVETEDFSSKSDIKEKIKSSWTPAKSTVAAILSKKIFAKNFDFYLTNSLARSSRTLNKYSSKING
jgi:NADH-quinone oxidoreductase subunit G